MYGIKVRSLVTMLTFNFNRELTSFEDRIRFVYDNIEHIENNPMLLSRATTYLLTSTDIEDGFYFSDMSNIHKTTPDYKSFRRFKDAWLKSHSLIFSRGTNLTYITESEIQSNAVVDILPEEGLNHEYISRLFHYKNIDSDTIKGVLQHGHKIYEIEDIDPLIFNNVEYILELANEVTKNNRDDKKFLTLYAEGLTITSIAEIMGVSKQAISKRLAKIVRNIAKKGLTLE